MPEVWQATQQLVPLSGTQVIYGETFPFMKTQCCVNGLMLWKHQYQFCHNEEVCLPNKALWHWHKQLLSVDKTRSTLMDLGLSPCTNCKAWWKCARGPAYDSTNIMQRCMSGYSPGHSPHTHTLAIFLVTYNLDTYRWSHYMHFIGQSNSMCSPTRKALLGHSITPAMITKAD